LARVSLQDLHSGRALNVELTPDRYATLGLKTGDDVFVVPRRVRVFVPDYVI
jgi:hypothetical protein